jgi:FkbM family methyltransferase
MASQLGSSEIAIKRFAERVRETQRTLEWLRSFSIRSVLDIGANEGVFLAAISGFFPSSTITAFEPLPPQAQMLSRRARNLPNPSRVYPIALGDKNGVATIFSVGSQTDPEASELSSLRTLKAPVEQYSIDRIDEITAVVRRLDDVVAEEGIDLTPDLLIKIDVQGYEAEVIEGGRHTIQKARVLLIEFVFEEIYEGQRLFVPMMKQLCEAGFEYIGNLDSRNLLVQKGLCTEVDAAFVRKA